MGPFGSFLGQGDGYTKAQRTGLRRSAEIKKRRKGEERAFEKSQEKEKGERALAERRMMETGAARRAGMTVTGGLEEQEMSNIGQIARQRLMGGQAAEAARVGGIRTADIASIEHARGLTTAELGHRRAMELEKVKGIRGLESLFSESGEAGTPTLGREAEPTKSVLTGFLAMSDSEKRTHMTRLKKEDPDAFLSLAKQYKMWAKPKKELPEEEYSNMGGRPIYQSDSGTYRNF
ncbi:MAG: hypothetical protein BA863_12310 [Desulfovibrio sp. S3730MH75]|nr:MAG: hypothetical protein BA863_12310 [Desulfovibrio sp. S3730MH75]